MNKKIITIISILVIIVIAVALMMGCNNSEKVVDTEKTAKSAETVNKVGNISKPKTEEVKTEETKEEVKTEEEKVEEEVKEDEKVEENIVKNSSSNTVKNNTSNNTSTQSSTTNNSTTTQNNTSTSTSTQNTTTETKKEEPKHEHSWTAVYKTINHPAEYKTVHHDAEYKIESVPYTEVEYYTSVFCECGATFNNHNERKNHVDSLFLTICPDTPGLTFAEAANSIDYYDAYVKYFNHCSASVGQESREVTKYRDEQVCVKEAYDEKVLVKEAWTEEVVDYYKCSCGAKK